MSKKSNKSIKQERKAKIAGLTLATSFHLVLAMLFITTGLKEIHPPPPVTAIVIDFEPDPPTPVEVMAGHQPRVERSNPSEDVRLVQRSQSTVEGTAANLGAESTMGEEGDVDIVEPDRERVIDQRALFPSASNRDSLAPQTASDRSQEIRAGHPLGNTQTGSVEGEPQARLAGRSVMGSLPEPEYTVNKAGRVVVRISVDQYGTVISATPGATGTTVQDRVLWEASKKAALEAKFNLSSNAPPVQDGTITYIFRLR